MGIAMLEIRRSRDRDRLIFNMGIPILLRQHIYIETAPRSLVHEGLLIQLFGDLLVWNNEWRNINWLVISNTFILIA